VVEQPILAYFCFRICNSYVKKLAKVVTYAIDIYLMKSGFIAYQKFNDPALAEKLAAQLEKHGIECLLIEEARAFDVSFAYNSELRADWTIKIRSEDFGIANELLKEDETDDVNDVEKDYYLFSFTNNELMEVVSKADEWSAFDVVLARKLLAERGISISDEKIATINEQRIEALKETEPPQTFWIVVGYFLAVMGGLLGLFIGWHLKTHKKTLPDGERVYDYSERDRWHGAIIFYLSIIGVIVAIVYRLTPVFSLGY
jgi:hypothetical protein